MTKKNRKTVNDACSVICKASCAVILSCFAVMFVAGLILGLLP